MASGFDIELPAVPGAGDDGPAKLPLRERPARMRTDAIQSIKAGFEMKQGDDSAPRDEFTAGSYGHVRNRGQAMALGHALIRNPSAINRPSAVAAGPTVRAAGFSSGGAPRNTVPGRDESQVPGPP